jgi:hypothetical protein
MEDQGYNGLPNREQLATYQKIAAMSKLINNTQNTDLNRDGSTILYVLLHKSRLQFVNDFEEGGF